MSSPWEDPVANAIIEFAEAARRIANSLEDIGMAMNREQDRKDKEYRDKVLIEKGPEYVADSNVEQGDILPMGNGAD